MITEEEKNVLSNLENDLKLLSAPINETLDEIIKEGYTKYPVLIAHAEPINFSDTFIDKKDFDTHFYFSAATLENLIEKGILQQDKLEIFKQELLKNKSNRCIILVHPAVIRVIFTEIK